MVPMIAAYDETSLSADIASIGTMKRALEIVGGLSQPSKMPGWAYNLPADTCITGGKLRHVKGSTCHGCYAASDVAWQQQGGRMMMIDGKLHGSRYATKTVQNALRRRFASLSDPLWTPAMALAIGKKADRWFRWFDSGDLQSEEMLHNIFVICRATPKVTHWLPTREKGILTRGIKLYGEPPKNLCIRASANMINGAAPKWPTASIVVAPPEKTPKGVHLCPAPKQGNKCDTCRKCWSNKIAVVAYTLH